MWILIALIILDVCSTNVNVPPFWYLCLVVVWLILDNPFDD